MVARLSTGQDRYDIWTGLVGSQTAQEFWSESQAQGATTYREAAEAYIDFLRDTQGLVSEAGWPEEDVPTLIDMLVEVLEEELGPQSPSSITWTGEVVPRPGRLLREWRGYRLHAEDTDDDPNVLVIVDQDGNMAWFDAGLREWEDFDDLLALLVDDMDAGRLQWYEGE